MKSCQLPFEFLRGVKPQKLKAPLLRAVGGSITMATKMKFAA